MRHCSVIDSNMIQSPLLGDWLAASSDHLAILPDFVWIEIYKQQSVASIRAALTVIGAFPDRIRLIKPGGKVADLDPRRCNMAAQMIEPDTHLRQMTEAIALAERGDPTVLAEFAIRWEDAAAHIQEMAEGAVDIVESLPGIAAIFTAEEVRLCRTNGRYTVGMSGKIFGSADQIYESLIEARRKDAPLSESERIDAYLYRYALAMMIYALWWIRTGNQKPKRLERLRNDMIDLSFAVYGTYFDGLLTNDSKCNWMYANLSGALNMARASAG